MRVSFPGLCAVVCVLILVAAAGCTSPGGAGPAAATPVSGAVQDTGRVIDLNDPAALKAFLEKFDTYAETSREKAGISGMAVAVVKDGNVIFMKGYGTKTVGKADPVTNDTVFQIGSTSKAFTAALVAMEVDRGRMNWSDPMTQYVPDFAMSDPWVTKEYTITDSLAQRSGIGDHWGMDLATFGLDRADMIHALRYAEPVSSFRSSFMYQNVPFVATGAAIEKTSGKTWEDNLQERIFTPLHMTGASSTYAAFQASPDHVTLYRHGVLSNNTTGAIPIDPDWAFNNVSYEFGPAGGINANIQDMAAWTIFQLGNGSYNGQQLISPAGMAYMHTPRTPVSDTMISQKNYYCQAWMYTGQDGTPDIVWHDGETLGSHSVVLMVPSRNLGIVVLANEAGGTALPDGLAFAFYRQAFGLANPDVSAIVQAQADKSNEQLLADQPVRPARPAEPLAPEKYTGSYTNTLYGKAVVAEQAGNLTLTFGKTPVTFVLSPWDGNTFASTCPQWGPDYHGQVMFATGRDGTVTGLTTSLILDKDFKRDAAFVRV